MTFQTRIPAVDTSGDTGLWGRARQIFERVLTLPVAKRPREAGALCDGDRALAMAVGSLLAWDVATTRPLLPSSTEPDPEPDRTGEVVGGYRLVRWLGRGGAGVVYLAERRGGGASQLVAIKLPTQALHEEARRCLAAEHQILVRLEHPGIVRLIDGGDGEGGESFLALEWIDGIPLTAFCEARCLPVALRLALFAKVCQAVEHAHQRLVVHLDLKPANILVDRAGRPCLLDFGIAQVLDGESACEPGRRAEGFSPSYASPEQILGEPVSPASDVYSLGIVLHEMLTGFRPQNGNVSISDELDGVVGRCLEPRPERRYGSAGDLARGLVE